MVFKSKLLILVISILFLMMCISCVSAGDTNNLNSYDFSKNQTWQTLYGYGSFDELNSDIQNLEPENIYDIQKDYIYNEKHDECYEKGILINTDNITSTVTITWLTEVVFLHYLQSTEIMLKYSI